METVIDVETAVKSNDSSPNVMSFQTKIIAKRLKSEYGLMKQLLNTVKLKVLQLSNSVDRSADRCPLQENTLQQNKSFLFVENQEIRRQLEKAILDLKGIQIENGREHRYLKSLQDELKKQEEEGLISEELTVIVTELTNEHVTNCQLKKEVENSIQKAKQKASRVKSPTHRSLNDVCQKDDDFSFFKHAYDIQ
ncbi:hypothetical protein SNE40_023330 [Patella caerulea]